MKKAALAPVALVVAASVLAFAAWPGSARAAQGAVATVNGSAISAGQLALAVQQHHLKKPSAKQRQQLVQGLVNRRLLADAAHKLGLDNDPTLKAELVATRESVLAQAAVAHYLKQHPITNKELHQRYRHDVNQLPAKQYKVRAIVVKTHQEAQSIKKELDSGGSFANLAKAHSKLPNSRVPGGELGWRFAKQFRPPVAAAIETTKQGQASAPVYTPQGWWIIETEGERPTKPGSFKQAKNGLRQEMQRLRLQQYIQDLRKQANVTVNKG